MSIKVEHYDKTKYTPGVIELAESKNKSLYSIQTGEALMGSLPNNYYLDIGSANTYQAIISHGIIKSAGANTSTNTGKLIDSGATFESDTVKIGHTVLNLTDKSEAKVVSIDSEIQLTIDADIFQATSKSYKVGPDVFQLPQAYVAGQPFYIAIANNNTGASTLNINSIGAISIRHPGGAVMDSGGLQAGRFYKFIYDGTYFIVEYGRTSQTPTANTIPVSEGDGKLNSGWVDSITEATGLTLKSRIFEINNWNMDIVTAKTIGTNILAAKIRSLDVTIMEDTGGTTYPLDMVDYDHGNTVQGGIKSITNAFVTLTRLTGGNFDHSDFNGSGVRGWMTIWHIE